MARRPIVRFMLMALSPFEFGVAALILQHLLSLN
jgi:hypothetical protein